MMEMSSKMRIHVILVIVSMIDICAAQIVAKPPILQNFNQELRLLCDVAGANKWFKFPRGKNIALNSVGIPAPEWYDLTDTAVSSTLVIRFPNWTDVGETTYFAGMPITTSTTIQYNSGCTFSIYYYLTKPNTPTSVFQASAKNLDPSNLDLNILFQNENLDTVKQISWTVAFPFTLNFNYRLETIPLSRLLVNDQVIPTSDCKDSTRTFCLNSTYSYTIPKCIKTFTLPISYSFDDRERYSTLVQPFNYKIEFSFPKYPPQTVTQYATRYVKTLTENVTLDCEIFPECGDASAFDWERNGIKIPALPNQKILNYFPNLTSKKDAIEVKCIAHGANVISSLSTSTTFTVKFKQGLEDWEIALIVVGSVLAVALIIGLIVLIWKVCLKSSSSTAAITKGGQAPPTRVSVEQQRV